MNIAEAVSNVLGNYATFNGRACRSEFWWWWLVNTLVQSILFGLVAQGANFVLGIYWLAILLPTLAVTVRRHHDGNRSGWFILLGLIPIIGGLILLFLYVSKGTDGPNEYGPDPLGPMDDRSPFD